MRETPGELDVLQALLDRSHAAAGEHLRAIFDEEHRLAAGELAAALDGIFEMHLATVAGDGAPLVAPIDGLFFKGKIWFGFPPASVRARLVRRDPRVSASYTGAESFAFVVHGTARELDENDPCCAEYQDLLRELYVAAYGPGWIDWYERLRRGQIGDAGFNGRIEPRVMFAKR